MQKFVIVKHAAQKPKSMDIFETQVRMSGYLKKKRNKIGGWRKLWFVLQNQLLLSYTSREDYEKKLAPFKDVLNLVPGSIVRPASGSRFTIETTSNTIYTFRCGDSKTCAEWIMALLESLGLNNNPQSVIEKNLSFVMANNNLFNVARSCESLSSGPMAASKKQHHNNLQSQAAAHPIISRSTPKLVRLPISTSTKRLMQRGGYIDDCNYIKLDRDHFQITGSTDDIDVGVLGVQNFRLHHTALKHNHSTEVSRINRMFQNKSTAAAAASTTTTADTVDAVTINNKPNRNQFFIMNRGDKMKTNKNVNDPVVMQENMVIISQIQQRLALRDSQKYRDTNNLLVDGQIYANTEEQMQHLILDDETDCDMERSFSEADILKYSKYNQDDDDDDDDDGDDGGDGKEAEVIYAVVDLGVKHARRAKLKKENTGRERPHSFTVPLSTNDYEEVNNYSPELFPSFKDANENIYEPVKGGRKCSNVSNSQKQKGWRYFPKIRLNFLGDSHKNHKQKETSERTNAPPSSCSSSLGTTSATTSSNGSSSSTSFFDMKRRLGHHRRSIKNKMKQFYDRNSNTNNSNNLSEINDNSNSNNINNNNNNNSSSSNNNIDTPLIIANSSNEFDKKTKEKHTFFGSLPRMKKSRTAPSIVEQTIPAASVENSNCLPKKHSKLPNLNGSTTVI